MPFIRLSDNYIDHPKFLALSASAFRLWHEGMAFCRKHQTDGLIPQGTLQGFRYYQAVRVKELATPYQPTAHPLWETVVGVGYKVHDYLFWNLSKEEEQAEKDGATKRMRDLRGRRRREDAAFAVGSPVRSPVCSPEQMGERSPNVRDMDRSSSSFQERESERKPVVRGATYLEPPVPEDLNLRAGQLLQKYAELFYQHQRGARYHSRPHLDHPKAEKLVETWPDDARLYKLAELILTTDDDWISKTDRGFAVFAAKASWADAALAKWEDDHQVKA